MIASFLRPSPWDLVINNRSFILKLWWPEIATFIIGHVIFHFAMIIGTIGLDKMALPIGDARHELANEDWSIFMIHLSESIRPSSLVLVHEIPRRRSPRRHHSRTAWWWLYFLAARWRMVLHHHRSTLFCQMSGHNLVKLGNFHDFLFMHNSYGMVELFLGLLLAADVIPHSIYLNLFLLLNNF